MNIFEIAARKKFRFQARNGFLSVEDLWDLPLTSQSGRSNLDDIAKALYLQLKQNADTISFVTEETVASAAKELLQQHFDIVKHVIDVRLAENKAKVEELRRADQKQKLLALIEQKQNDQLSGQTLEELQKQLAAL